MNEIVPDTPLRLKKAAEIAFPVGGMTASGLRQEAKRGRLVIERIANKDFTTLRHIEEMRKQCRDELKARDCGCNQPERTATERSSSKPCGSIRDGSTKRSTGCGARETERAARRLRDYLNGKPTERLSDRDPAAVAIADVVAIYTEDVVSKHARPKETAARLSRILDFFGGETLAYLNKKICADYVKARGSAAAARRELEDLRSAVRHHWEAGLCMALTPVVLPERGSPRERWLTRQEAAHFLRTARRMRQLQFGKETDRATAYHVAQFFLVGLYTGTRAGAICGAALDQPTIGRSWIDLEAGIFYRQAIGRRKQKNKRQTPVRLPPRLLAHLRRWKRIGLSTRSLIEWNGEPV